MLHKIGSDLLKRQLMLWMMGRAKPSAPVLLPFVRIGLLGLAASIAGGLLLTIGFIGLLAALYLWIAGLGLEPALALLIVSSVTFLLVAAIGIAMVFAFKRRVGAIQNAIDEASPSSIPIDDAMIEVPRAILTGFLEGVLGERSSTHNHTPRD